MAENKYFCTQTGKVARQITYNQKMATREEYEQLKAFARIDGAMVGGLWILSFACFVGEFHNPMFGMLSLLIGVGSLIFAAVRLRLFRDNVLDGRISFRRAFGYSLLTFAYAALLMAAAQYIYFQFIDQGFIISKYTEMASTEEFKSLMGVYGIKQEEMNAAMETLSSLRPIDIALQFITTNIILGVIISLPIAAIMKSTYRKSI